MVHDEYKEMLPARALLLLDSSDNRALDEHLMVCLACRHELKELEETSALLSYAAAPMEPSPDLRERILNEIRSSRQTATAVDGVRRDQESQVLPFTTPKRNVWSSIGSLGAIAAAILFVALLVSVVQLWRENRATKSELAQLDEQIKTTQEQLAREREVVAILTTPGSRRRELAATTAAAPGAFATLAHDTNGRAVLIASGLPKAPTGKRYQLWFIVGNKPVPGKLFNTDESGSGALRDQVPNAALQKAVFAVTMESYDGADAPTGPILLMSDTL
jgi:Anti-sigma-K factor rskA